MTNKQKNVVFPLLIVGAVGILGVISQQISLIMAIFPIVIIIPTVINLYKGKSVGKLFWDGFIVAGIYVAVIIIVALLARDNEIAMAILQFPLHKG